MGKRMDMWEENYEVIWNFASENHRGPSRHRIEEHSYGYQSDKFQLSFAQIEFVLKSKKIQLPYLLLH